MNKRKIVENIIVGLVTFTILVGVIFGGVWLEYGTTPLTIITKISWLLPVMLMISMVGSFMYDPARTFFLKLLNTGDTHENDGNN